MAFARSNYLSESHTRYRRSLEWLVGLTVSVSAGLAAVFLPPMLVVGAVVAVAFFVLVLSRPFIGLLLYAMLFLLRPGELFPVLAVLRLERLVGSVTILGMFYWQIRTTGHVVIDRTPQTALLLGFVVATFVSVPLAVWRLGAVDGAIDIAKVLAFYIMVVHLVTTRARLRAFVVLFLALIAYIGMDSLSAYTQGSYKYAQGINRAVGQTDAGGDPNHLGTTMAATIPILLVLVAQARALWIKVLLMSSATMMGVTMLLTGSRASLLGSVAGFAFLWCQAKRKLMWASVAAAVVIVVVGVLPEQYKQRYVSITKTEIDGSSRGRIDAWRAGLDMLAESPLTGVGVGCFATAYQLHGGRYLESHSLYIQVPTEIGAIGASAFFGFVLATWMRFSRLRKGLDTGRDGFRFEHGLVTGLQAGLCVLLVSGVFGHNMQRHTWYVYAALGLVVERLLTSASPLEAQGRV